ncbi:MAG: T9SS type A sorting domain-containing protein [Flavobacteriales bacterium]|nr:T9SS type A sorting domain-containing protein [Flavobacteriales bacterium]
MRPLLLILCGALAGEAFGQRAVPASGGDAGGGGGSISYSVGQVDFTSMNSAGGTVSQGVQQAYEYLVLRVVDPQAPDQAVSVSPNPARDGITVESGHTVDGHSRYELLGADGSMLRTGRLAGSRTFIPMLDLPSAGYLLRIIRSNDGQNTFKILKQ